MKMSKEVDLGKERIGRLFFMLAVPAILSQLVNALYNMVDRMYIGHIPEVGATALTENLVFGQIAGALAAEESKKISIAQTLDWPDADRCVQGAQADPDASAFLMAEEQEIRRILWTCGGILRNGEGLSSGLVRLGVMTAHVSELPTPCFSQQQKKRRLMQLVALAQLVLQSALRRTESRGCHTRTDFPNQDPSQSASYFLTYERAK